MTRKSITVHGHEMSYIEMGQGDPIVFLHGNPTSAYLWRDVMPELAHMGRCIAPDLIGMGHSAKLPDPGPDTYTFATHQGFLDGFMQAMGLTRNVTLVIHDWGSALGFDWANSHRESVRAIAYMEGIVGVLRSWQEFNPEAAPLFQALRSPAGEELILDKNIFVERILTGSILRKLTEEEMTEYRRPFLQRQDRWPTLTWPRQIPVADEPEDVSETVRAYADWMDVNEVPKLFVNADPGAILIGAPRERCRRWKNQSEVTVKGSHFIQEDSGPEIGRAIADWLENL